MATDSATSTTAAATEVLQWLYIDNQGQLQGPFPDDKMRTWLTGGYFTSTTKVKLANETEFRELREHPRSFAVPKADAQQPPPPPPVPSSTTSSTASTATASATTSSAATPSSSTAAAPEDQEQDEDDEQPLAPEDVEWRYLDDDGKEQGPFPHAQMKEWYKQFFTPDTQVKAAHEPDNAPFVAIKDRKDCLFAGQVATPASATTTSSTPQLPAFSAATLAVPTAAATAAAVPQLSTKTRWFYLDDEDAERGPWSEKQMKLWYSKGFFEYSPEDGAVKIRKEGDSVFRALAEWQGPLPAWAIGYVPPKKVPGVSNRLDLSLLARPGFGFPMLAPPPVLLPGQPEPEWVYLDKDGVEQGPWSSQQMRQWYNAGNLPPQIRVREKGSGAPWTAIGARPCCFTGPPPPSAAVPPPPPPADGKDGVPSRPGAIPISSFPAGPPPAWLMNRPGNNNNIPTPLNSNLPPADYAQTAVFSGNNRFTNTLASGQAPSTHWERRGLAPDSAGRQMSHYFDFDKWQDDRNKASAKRKAHSAAE